MDSWVASNNVIIYKIVVRYNAKCRLKTFDIYMTMCYTKNTPRKERKIMYRKITLFFEEWKNSPRRKPLVVQGARQVGKTYSILEFGRTHYENVAYFNFERNKKLKKTFEEDISPARAGCPLYVRRT